MSKKVYNQEDLIRIGNNVASLWGASCISVEHNKEEKEYIFDCVEHGERFITRLKEDSMGEYDY